MVETASDAVQKDVLIYGEDELDQVFLQQGFGALWAHDLRLAGNAYVD